jgi:acyl-CoA thioesterase-1
MKCLLVAGAVLGLAVSRSAAETRILFLGDPIQKPIVAAADRELGSEVSIHFPPPAYDTAAALERLDELIGEGGWDLIYFNFGIGELFYRDPKTKEVRIMSKHAGGVRASTPQEYAERLDRLVRELRERDYPLLWASTTPLVTVNFFPSYQANLFDAHSELEYNAVAAEIMARHRVPVVDLHGHIMQHYEAEEKHPAYHQYPAAMKKKGKPLHLEVVRAIRSCLK